MVMEFLELKNAKFYSDKIVVRKKKREVIIYVEDIKELKYAKPTLFNYVFALGGTYPGRLEIWLNKEIGNRLGYFVKIKYKQIFELPEVYRKSLLLGYQ